MLKTMNLIFLYSSYGNYIEHLKLIAQFGWRILSLYLHFWGDFLVTPSSPCSVLIRTGYTSESALS